MWCFHPLSSLLGWLKLFFSNVVELKKRNQREICDFLRLTVLNLPGVR